MTAADLASLFQKLAVGTIILAAVLQYLAGKYERAADKVASSDFERRLAEASAASEDRLTSHLARIESLIGSPKVSKADLEAAKRAFESTTAMYKEVLLAEFPLGYALLQIHGTDWVAMPGTTGEAFNWKTTRIDSTSNNQLVISLPEYRDRNGNVMTGNRLVLPLKEGATAYPFRIDDMFLKARVIRVAAEEVTVALGAVPVSAGTSRR